MSKIEIDFNNLKYNLYEILNVPPTSDESKIKKSFMKLVKNFHPDKNSELEEDIYCHIILANQILLNKDSRKKYDNYLIDTAETFNELKSSFNKIEKPSQTNADSTQFNNKINELNKRHGYNSDEKSENTMDKFNKIKNNRDITVKQDIKNSNELNSKFMDLSKDQLVTYTGNPSELSTYVVGEQYTNLADLDKLYIEDSVQCSKFSSLDRAFAIHNIVTTNSTKSVSERLSEYKTQTEEFKNMKTTDFSNKKYTEL
jgi:curved DNA-binding protein CbpA